MATNEFWRRFARDLSTSEEQQGLYITPTLLETALLDISTGSGGITLAQARTHFGLQTGTDAGTEFGDFITSLQSLPGTSTGVLEGRTKLLLQERVLHRITSIARLGAWSRLSGANPYDTGEELRQRAKETIIAFGGTPVGTLAV